LMNAPAWQQSQGSVWLQAMLRGIRPMLPPEVSRHLPTT
jgi:membrane protein required for colicin V production